MTSLFWSLEEPGSEAGKDILRRVLEYSEESDHRC